MLKTKEDFPSLKAFARYLAEISEFDMTVATAWQRLYRGWEPEKVISIAPNDPELTRPKSNHPYKTASYLKMASKKIHRMRKNNG